MGWETVASIAATVVGKALGGSQKSPKVDAAPITQPVEDAQAQAKKARTALAMTEGGINGQELSVGQVGKRDTLFGN